MNILLLINLEQAKLDLKHKNVSVDGFEIFTQKKTKSKIILV